MKEDERKFIMENLKDVDWAYVMYPKIHNDDTAVDFIDAARKHYMQENGTWESALTLALLEILQQNTGSISLQELEQKLRDWMISRGLTQQPMVTFSNPDAGNFSIRVQ